MKKGYEFFIENYKISLLISLALLVIASAIILNNYKTTGQFFQKGMDFTGGTQAIAIVNEDFDISMLEKVAKENIEGSVVVKKAKSRGEVLAIIESDVQLEKKEIEDVLNKAGISYKDISIQSVSPAISQAFWKKALKAIIIAFVGMAIVVFITFKTFVPSIAIILAATSDMIFAISMMDLFGIKMSLATLSALLILIGYSVDTDILLSTRVLKRNAELNVNERIKSSAKTGLTMTLTSISSLLVLYLFTPSETLRTIALVIMFGLIADIPFTWLQNVAILKWYTKHKVKRK